ITSAHVSDTVLRGGAPVMLQQQRIFGGRLTTTVVFWRSKLYITRIHTAVHVLLMRATKSERVIHAGR
uniref:Uncharacterized protein n=1 Tax=Aegilops tauschii subsp. strangulata TaxID=200361 RepID=A0A453M5N1_AEGTS